MCKYEMDQVSIVEDTERTWFCPQTETDKVKPVYSLSTLLGGIYRIMHELPWITIFGSRVRRFANNFHEWKIHEWKSLANHITSDSKIFIHGNECIIIFLTCYFMSWRHSSTKNNHRSLISPLSLKNGLFWLSTVTSPQFICGVTWSGIVTLYSLTVFARANWRKGDLH